MIHLQQFKSTDVEMVQIPKSSNVEEVEPKAAVNEETALLGDENVPCQVQKNNVDEVQREEISESEMEEEMALLPCDTNKSAKSIMVDENECTFIATKVENRGNFKHPTWVQYDSYNITCFISKRMLL